MDKKLMDGEIIDITEYSNIKISDRLRTIAGCVTHGNIAADIGCDHGLTSIYLIVRGISPRVYALDINEYSIETARKNITLYGLEHSIIVRQSDGTAALNDRDGVETILISGMGGNLIIKILGALFEDTGLARQVKELVLSPQSDISKVRRYLHASGYCIGDETMVFDAGKYYNIICARPGIEQYNNDTEYRYGKINIIKKESVFMEYMKHELYKKQEIHKKIETAIKTMESDKLVAEKTRIISEMEAVRMIIS